MSPDLLDVGGGVLLVDGLCGDGSPPSDWLHDVGGQRRFRILLVIRGQERGLGLLGCLLEQDFIRILKCVQAQGNLLTPN